MDPKPIRNTPLPKSLRIKNLLSASFDLDSENYSKGFKPFVARRDGTFIVRETFFYTGGRTMEDVIAKIRRCLPGFKVVVPEAREVVNNWPKESYWEVVFRLE